MVTAMNQSDFRLWENEAGIRCWRKKSPGDNWTSVSLIHEDELPADMSDDDYSRWFNESIVDGVRIGPATIARKVTS